MKASLRFRSSNSGYCAMSTVGVQITSDMFNSVHLTSSLSILTPLTGYSAGVPICAGRNRKARRKGLKLVVVDFHLLTLKICSLFHLQQSFSSDQCKWPPVNSLKFFYISFVWKYPVNQGSYRDWQWTVLGFLGNFQNLRRQRSGIDDSIEGEGWRERRMCASRVFLSGNSLSIDEWNYSGEM